MPKRATHRIGAARPERPVPGDTLEPHLIGYLQLAADLLLETSAAADLLAAGDEIALRRRFEAVADLLGRAAGETAACPCPERDPCFACTRRIAGMRSLDALVRWCWDKDADWPEHVCAALQANLALLRELLAARVG